jgi:hypothetical protein
MTNFKPSELPVGTVIDVEDDRQYTKESTPEGSIFWNPDACLDCHGSDSFSDLMADHHFKHFEIVSVPWATAVNMAIKLQDEYGYTDAEGEDITIEGLIESALEETVELQAKLAADKRLDVIRNAIEAAKA